MLCDELQFKDQMNKQTGMHEGVYEVLRRIGDFVKEGHVLPKSVSSMKVFSIFMSFFKVVVLIFN